jgi:L-ascorbate metabolism protein UlaG (beta-lactamase superfamily)
MEITWLGHSCFRLKGSDAIVVTDPCGPDYGYNIGKLTASIVTTSHQHADHSYVQAVSGARVIGGPGEYEFGGILIIGMPTYHDDQNGAERGKNTVFLIKIDEVTICHLGDLGHLLTSQQAELLGNIDVLLIPVGGVYTIDAQAAAKVARQLEPKIVIPMHYKTPVEKLAVEPVDRFLNEMGAGQLEPVAKLSVTRTNLPDSLQVRLLSY